ncbi:hypothetical protein HDU96_005423 [Phlyctochytrium bullatum]|nr:hypothetical protein HDU96_005423 [Phlyctochytrium bullatum]
MPGVHTFAMQPSSARSAWGSPRSNPATDNPLLRLLLSASSSASQQHQPAILLADGAAGTLLTHRLSATPLPPLPTTSEPTVHLAHAALSDPSAPPPKPTLDALSLAAPAWIHDLHASYLRAGARLITTNTFMSNPPDQAAWSAHVGKDPSDWASALTAAGVGLARTAAAPTGAFVAASLGPTGLTPADGVGRAQAVRHQMAALAAAGGADLVVLETVYHGGSGRAAVEAAVEVAMPGTVLGVWFAVNDAGELFAGGERVEEVVGWAVRRAVAAETVAALVVGVNCGMGPESAGRALRAVAGRVAEVLKEVGARRVPVALAYVPAAGKYATTGEGIEGDEAKEEGFARAVVEAVDTVAEDGLREGWWTAERMVPLVVVGGCCGTTPRHVEAVKLAFEDTRHVHCS